MTDPRELVDVTHAMRRVATEPDWPHTDYRYVVDIGRLRALLAAQGLHIVTAQERAVLDEMAVVSEYMLPYPEKYGGYLDRVCESELARRAAKAGK